MTLAEFLKSRGIKRKDFAERIGVTAQSVARYLAGEAVPRLDVMKAIHRETAGAVTANDFYDLPDLDAKAVDNTVAAPASVRGAQAPYGAASGPGEEVV